MTTFDVRPVESFEMDSWDAFVESQPGGSIYHASAWKRLIDQTYGDGTYTIIAAFDRNGIAGGFCALTRSRLLVETAVTPLLTPYTGYLAASATTGDQPAPSESGESASAIMALSDFARRFRYQSLQCAPHFGPASLLAESGYNLVPRRTLAINLSLPEDELWSGFAGNARRNIKKAQRSDYQISDNWDSEQAWSLFEQTFTRRGQKCIVPKTYFIETCTGNIMGENRTRYCAWDGDRLLAFLVALHFKSTVYYHLAAADSDALKAGVPSLLVWELMRDYASREYSTFDFVGGNTPAIARFKEGFGAESVPHYILERCSSRRIKISRGLRRLLMSR